MKKIINIAVIGGGYNSTISGTHLKSILATGKYKVSCGFFSKDKNKNIKNSSLYGLDKNKAYNDLNQLLVQEKNNFDIALVLVPPNSKYKIFKELAKHNVDIISEKPFDGNLRSAKKSYELLKKKKIFFATTYNYLGYPAIMEIKPLIKKKIGKVLNFIIEMPQQAFTYQKSKVKKWRLLDLEIPNLHLDLASHLLSLVIYFFNENPREVMSFQSKQINKNIVDNSYAWLKFKEFNGSFWFSKNATGERNALSIRIFGTNGSIKWEHSNPENIVVSSNNGNIEIINRLSAATKHMSKQKNYTYSAGHPNGFLDAFINIYNRIYEQYKNRKKIYNDPSIVSLKDNLNIISILDAMNRSSKKNVWHKIKTFK
jgi:predicted dehydrogenase